MVRRSLGGWAVALVLALAAGGAGAAPSVILEGRYTGTDEAAGLAVTIAPDSEGFTGTWHGRAGAQDFLADRRGDIAEAVLDLPGGTTLMRLAPQPYGAEAVLIPVARDGQLRTGQGRLLRFLAEGVESARLPEGHKLAPTPEARGQITGVAFLRSYRWWRPAGVARGYLALSESDRALIRLFAPVQLDLIWKLCLAPNADTAAGRALRGAEIGCPEARAGLAAAQRAGRYRAYRAEVAEARRSLIRAMRCARGERAQGLDCTGSADAVARAATALETPAGLLARYR